MGNALFFSPHPDDETLQQAVEIGRHVESGWTVTVVCGADGSGSGALGLLNGASSCGFHGYRHDPAAEGRSVLTPAQLSAYRQREMESACAALRVDELVHGTVPDGQLTVEAWRDILLSHEYRVAAGGTVFLPTPWETTSGHGNTDHGNAGVAMGQLRTNGHYGNCGVAYTVFSRYWGISGCPGGIQRGPGTTEESHRLLAAADAYRAWSPHEGALGIGWCHSVASDFGAGFVDTGSGRYLLGRYHR